MAKKPHHENPVEHFAEEVEEHFLDGAELATSTTSAETNALLAIEGAIVGPRTPKTKVTKKPQAKAEKKRSHARPKKVRSKKR